MRVLPLDLVKSVVDPIHGLIRMTKEEHDLISEREFQRLRGIKQNGLLHLVFPAATHTRFEHSLGVMHVADGVLQALHFNSKAEEAKGGKGALQVPDEATAGLAVDFSLVGADVLEPLFRVTRLAALVHDLGHGPLSHSFDKIAPHQDRVQPLLAELGNDAVRALLDGVISGVERRKRGAIGHEVLSCILFCDYWTRARKPEPWVPLAVAAAVLGRERVTRAPDGVPDRLAPWLPLIQDIIASAPVDADRLDYIERDSASCGVHYGLYDRDRILKSALCYRDKDRNFRLGWKLSGLRAIEVFVHARFQLFAQIYYHKTNAALNEMIEDIVQGLEGAELVPCATLKELVDWYCTTHDDAFLRQLTRVADGREPKRVNDLARRIMARDNLYKRLYETTPSMSAEAMERALCQRYEGEVLPIRARVSRLEATKNLEKGAVLLRRDREGRYAASRDSDTSADWLNASPMMRALHEEERRIERLFWTGDDVEQRDRLRHSVHQLTGA